MTTDDGNEAVQGQRSRYRPSALARYKSPERLDRVARVADAKAWIGVLVGVVVVLLALAWGIWGGVPNQVTMSVEMVREGAFATLTADAGGTVGELLVRPGDTVSVGEPVLVLTSGSDGGAVTATHSGTVQGLSVSVGDVVESGDRLATIVDEASSGTLTAVTYVGSSDAVELRSHPDALVEPAAVDPSLHGQLRGTVSFVADVAATPEEMAATLQSASLADALLDDAGGVPYLVRITFPDPPVWTNEQAPPFEITDGMRADAIATVGSTRPIDLLFGS